MTTQLDYFLEEIASHSSDCGCSTCERYDMDQAAQEEAMSHQTEQDMNCRHCRENAQPDYSNANSPTGEVD